MEPTVVDVLLLAKDQIAEEGHWCQGTESKTERRVKPMKLDAPMSVAGRAPWEVLVPYEIEEVVSFCMRGAVREAAMRLGNVGIYVPAIQALAAGILDGGYRRDYLTSERRDYLTSERVVVSTNDTTGFTQQDALDTFDRAIAIEKNKTH